MSLCHCHKRLASTSTSMRRHACCVKYAGTQLTLVTFCSLMREAGILLFACCLYSFRSGSGGLPFCLLISAAIPNSNALFRTGLQALQNLTWPNRCRGISTLHCHSCNHTILRGRKRHEHVSNLQLEPACKTARTQLVTKVLLFAGYTSQLGLY